MRKPTPEKPDQRVEIEGTEDWRAERSPAFWKMIEERRRRPTVRLDDVLNELIAPDGERHTS